MDLVHEVVSGTNLLTPWFPRQADNAIFAYQAFGGAASFGIDLVHKNLEDAGVGEFFDQMAPITWTTHSDGFRTYTAIGLKELVRFKIVSTGAGLSKRVRLIPPTWFNSAEYP